MYYISTLLYVFNICISCMYLIYVPYIRSSVLIVHLSIFASQFIYKHNNIHFTFVSFVTYQINNKRWLHLDQLEIIKEASHSIHLFSFFQFCSLLDMFGAFAHIHSLKQMSIY